VDNHASALARARDLAIREGVADRCAFVQINLRKLPLSSPLTRDQIKGKVPLPPPRPSALFDAINSVPRVPTAEYSEAAGRNEAAGAESPEKTAEPARAPIEPAAATNGDGGVLGHGGRIALVHGHRFLDRTLLLHVRCARS